MAKKRNDFMEGFLKGLYGSGVGNPEVQRANEAAMRDQNMKQDLAMANKGMIPNPQGEDPMKAKIGSFISTMFGGASTAPRLASSYQVDPTAPRYYQEPTGAVSFATGTDPLPQGSVPLSKDKGPGLAASFGKLDRSNTSFENAKSMATLAKQPHAFDTVIAEATKQGRDYVTKEEMSNAMKAISTGATSERGNFYKNMVGVHRERLDLAKRQAVYGRSGYGGNQVSLNTALEHSATLMDSFRNLGNTNIELMNIPINEWKAHTDDPNIIAIQAKVVALSDELSTAFKGTSGTDIQMQAWAEFLKTSLTPSQAEGLLPQISDLLDARLTNLERQQKLLAPSVVKEGTIKSPSAIKAQNKINENRKGAKIRVSNGNETFDVDLKDLPDALKEGFKQVNQ